MRAGLIALGMMGVVMIAASGFHFPPPTLVPIVLLALALSFLFGAVWFGEEK